MNKVELANKIKNLEGLTNDEKSSLLELLHEQKKYGLVWEEKPENIENQLKEQIPVLTEVKERAIINRDACGEPVKSTPNHVLIEGDNLAALTALSYTHEGKIDVIYIDPPYNTVNRDFVYNDSFVDKEDCYRHSKWLSFMDKRLRIAKRLLSDKGVIFISIDDNEQANLKLLCEEMFGGNNFLAQIIWERAYSPVNLKKHFSESHDYIISYARDKEIATCNGIPRTAEANDRYSNPDNDPRGPWKAGDLSVGPAVESNIYPIVTPSGRICLPPSGYSWRLSETRLNEFIANNRISFGPDGNSTPAIKRFLSEVKQGITPMTIWKYQEVGHSQDATKELKDIFGGKALFTYPKSERLIRRIIQLYSCTNSTILDFFAGSGTTLHATMQLNAEDGGHRKCILVTNNENNICEEVTYERNKRVINGYTTPNGVEVEGLTNNNLRYYKTEFVPRENTSANRRALMSASVDLFCIKENIYTEQETFGGRKFKKSVLRYFEEGGKQMLVVLDERVISLIIPMIADVAKKESPMKVFVFSDGQYAYEDEFHEVMPLIDLCALPDAIYQALNKVLPERQYSEEMIAEFNQEDAEEALQDTYNYKTEEGGEK